jgi:hypothetical protein
MARIYQSASSYGLASWMRPQQGGLPIQRVRKSASVNGKLQRRFFYVWITVLQKYFDVV